VTQYLFSCMLLICTLHIYSWYAVSRARPSWQEEGMARETMHLYQDIVTCTATGLAPRLGLGSTPTTTAHVQSVLHSETKLKVHPKKISPHRLRAMSSWRRRGSIPARAHSLSEGFTAPCLITQADSCRM